MYEDIVYVSDDGRNATRPVVVTRHDMARVRPVTPAGVTAAGTTAMGPYQYPQYAQPQALQSAYWPGYSIAPNYVIPQPPPTTNLSSILGGFGDLGSLTNIVAQVVAAFLPLPKSPEPLDSSDNDKVASQTLANSSNMIRYQNALALFARRDQQILTLGSVLKELLRRPGMVG